MSSFLIADDNPGKVLMLEALVKKSGIAKDVVTAATTEDAKELIDRHTIDFAFIDYEMPTEDGPAVIAYLKKKNPAARIALVSSSNSDRYQQEAEKAGSEAYICTTFEEDEVMQRIEDLLESWSH